jgi:carotenoid cleavage dioxygenase-like enzyme
MLFTMMWLVPHLRAPWLQQDAQDFAGEPIATIRLPVRVPFRFHGGWAPDVNAAASILA